MRRASFAASSVQREKVRDLACVVCCHEPSDPAHLTARAQGGCDDALCVLPLCRSCHEAFDHGFLDLESVLAMRQFAPERAHMASHLTFEQCRRRLRGIR